MWQFSRHSEDHQVEGKVNFLGPGRKMQTVLELWMKKRSVGTQ